MRIANPRPIKADLLRGAAAPEAFREFDRTSGVGAPQTMQRARSWPASSHTDRNALRACLAVLVLSGLFLLYVGRHLSFYFDEWAVVMGRQGSSIGTYLDSHGGHFILFIVVVYKLLFAIVGLRHYIAFRAVGIAMDLACAVTLYLLLRRRIGAWYALVPMTSLALLGCAWQDLLWPFQIGFLISVWGGLAALLFIESGTRRGDLLACVALLLAITGSAVGLASLAAAAAGLIVRRGGARRLWLVAVPAVVFALWDVGYGMSETIDVQSLLGAPRYMASAAGGAIAGILGLNGAVWGYPLLFGLAVLLVLTLVRAPKPVSPLLFGALIGAVAFWFEIAVIRGNLGMPQSSRYLYVGAAFVLVVIGELFRAWGAQVRPALLAVGLAVALAALLSNIGMLRTGEQFLRVQSESVGVALATTEVAGPAADPALQPDAAGAPDITAGPYLRIIRTLGSPALTYGQLLAAPEALRLSSDKRLEHLERIDLTRYAGALRGDVSPQVSVVNGALARSAAAGCLTFAPSTPAGSIDLVVPPGLTLLMRDDRGPITVWLARLAGGFENAPAGTIRAGTTESVTFPIDARPSLPWTIALAGAAPVRVCERRDSAATRA